MKQDILQKARELFLRKGYEKTSINEIVKSLNISKGGFYHHFKSKEDLLDEMAKSHTAMIETKLKKITDLEISSQDKIVKFLKFINNYKHIRQHLNLYRKEIEGLEKIDNHIFKEKNNALQAKLILPQILKILEKGIEEKDFNPLSNKVVIAHIITSFTEDLKENFNAIVIAGIENPDNITYWLEYCKTYNLTINYLLGTENLKFLSTGFK